MPLPDPLLDAVFAKLAATYGKRFVSQFSVTSPATFRREWAQALEGISERAIGHALANLPTRFPPTVLEFKAIAAHAQTRPLAKPVEKREVTPMPEGVKARLEEVTRHIRMKGG